MKYLVKKVFHIKEDQAAVIEGILGGMIPIGASIGVILIPKLLQYFSRKNSLILCDIIGIIGSAVAIFANIYSFVIHRFIIGLITGANSLLVPLYIREISPIIIYSRMGYIYSLFIYFGTAASYIIGFYCTEYSWRVPFLGIFKIII